MLTQQVRVMFASTALKELPIPGMPTEQAGPKDGEAFATPQEGQERERQVATHSCGG
eukprot:CAMPEP_0117686912 /NCGR_PEP_ID=MMETSP0804-20121206/22775_1 /TAXON_ID=1074897 /ORGANISM="Tetraselmis astigmatica, Strain CCMP880" /LENGTH=56 /DNA_ID=CAMNT_0005498781 /DNA_START=171 /DNA_END=344 /DNA_ORIENTATION=-